jgi:hypothetical protein
MNNPTNPDITSKSSADFTVVRVIMITEFADGTFDINEDTGKIANARLTRLSKVEASQAVAHMIERRNG